jgi:CRP-like cAMP-binding protein
MTTAAIVDAFLDRASEGETLHVMRAAARRLLRMEAFGASTSRHEMIETVAYAKWQEAGRPSGCDVEFWLDAERELIRQRRINL